MNAEHARGATAIVLARRGSKGLPGKNTADVCGRPCVAWTIDAALAAERVSRVVVSSDDPEVIAIACAMGAEAHKRDPALAADNTTVDAAARACVHEAAIDSEHVVMLYANVPVRPDGLIDRALALLAESGADSVQSYQPVGKYHPWWTAVVDDGGSVRPWEGDVLNHGVFRRQDLPPAHIPDGGVIALRRAALMLEVDGAGDGPHAFFGVDRRGVVNPEGSVVDIDGPTDLLVARQVLGGKIDTGGTEETPREGAKDERGTRGGGLVDADVTERVLAAAIEVHRELGPGLLESVYEACLARSLEMAGVHVERQVLMPVVYRNQRIEAGYRADLLVDRRVIVELKAVEQLTPAHEAQLLTYMRCAGLRVGLLLNFNERRLVDGLRRRVL